MQDPSILQTLGYLIENMPSQLNLILITRKDLPLLLSSLRANIQLTEVRARNLRLMQGEPLREYKVK